MSAGARPLLPWLVAVLALAVGLATALWRGMPPPAGGEPETPRISGEFTLLDASGKPVAWSGLNRRRQLVFFGFTHCPEACPTTLMAASRALAERGDAETGTRILFISVDPERDTPEVVGAYARNFGPSVTGLTGGDEAGVAAAAGAFHVFHEKMPPMEDGGYMVNHTAALFLLGAGDEILETIPYGATPGEIAAALARHPG